MLLYEAPGSAAGNPPLARVAPEMALSLRPFLDETVAEMVGEIERLIPDHARLVYDGSSAAMSLVVGQTVRSFVAAFERADADLTELTRTYEEIGAHEAAHDRPLDGIQAAIRTCGQVACRRFIRNAKRLDWPLEMLGLLTESLFRYLETITSAAGRGYAEARQRVAGEHERRRRRLREVLVADPPSSAAAISELARAADWRPPTTIAVVLIDLPDEHAIPVLPPDVLAEWRTTEPYLIVPEPERGYQARLIETLARGRRVAVGPPVPPHRGAVSLRWARATMALVARGAVPSHAPAHCVEHLATVAAHASEDLIRLAVRARLRPLLELKRHRRRPMAQTLLSYLDHGGNAVTTAKDLNVHEQTVRYRVRQADALFGDLLTDPDRRTELTLLLHAWIHLDLDEPAPFPASPV